MDHLYRIIRKKDWLKKGVVGGLAEGLAEGLVERWEEGLANRQPGWRTGGLVGGQAAWLLERR